MRGIEWSEADLADNRAGRLSARQITSLTASYRWTRSMLVAGFLAGAGAMAMFDAGKHVSAGLWLTHGAAAVGSALLLGWAMRGQRSMVAEAELGVVEVVTGGLEGSTETGFAIAGKRIYSRVSLAARDPLIGCDVRAYVLPRSRTLVAIEPAVSSTTGPRSP